jgi:ATP-dependent Clp protease adaptor protein ClpS
MSSNTQTAVAEPPVIESPEEKEKEAPEKAKPKRLPPYAVIVLNDDEHTYAYVIETFRKVFGYSTAKCWLLATLIDTAGRAPVWSGSKEVAELKRDQIRSAGPDFYATKKVDFPLGVVIEPLPQ